MNNKRRIIKRMIICGEPNTGKTTITRRLVGKSTKNMDYRKTIGFDLQKMVVNSTQNLEVSIFDYGGEFQPFQGLIFNSVDVILYVFALDDRKSFKKLIDWIEKFKKMRVENQILLANKVDLPKRKVGKDEITIFSSSNQILAFEISALKGYNFETFRTELIKSLLNERVLYNIKKL